MANCMAFAEVVANIAFLRTIPAPVFNSEFNIQFMDITLNLKENHFNEIPHKNMYPIKVLVECLDFQSILTCIKALLFDKTLIVFSIETSLLFNVVEGLKQLIFPFTFNYRQFLPANNNYRNADGQSLKDLFDDFEGMQPVIFALETKQNGIDIESYIDWPDSVLLDIDASYVIESTVMDQKLPPVPNEIEFMKILNRIKNRMLDNYDKVYLSESIPMQIDQELMEVNTIREMFFTILKPYLTAAFLAINTKVPNPKNMDEYFQAELYLKHLQENSDDNELKKKKFVNFGKRLMKSGSFTQFMDGYIEDDIMNFDLVNSILCFRGELSRRFKSQAVSLKQFDDQIQEHLKTMSAAEVKKCRQRCNETKASLPAFQDKCVKFYFRIPNNLQKMMLFEKVQFMNDMHYEKKLRMVRPQNSIFMRSSSVRQSKTNKALDEYDEFRQMRFCYKELVSLIRAVYKHNDRLVSEEGPHKLQKEETTERSQQAPPGGDGGQTPERPPRKPSLRVSAAQSSGKVLIDDAFTPKFLPDEQLRFGRNRRIAEAGYQEAFEALRPLGPEENLKTVKFENLGANATQNLMMDTNYIMIEEYKEPSQGNPLLETNTPPPRFGQDSSHNRTAHFKNEEMIHLGMSTDLSDSAFSKMLKEHSGSNERKVERASQALKNTFMGDDKQRGSSFMRV